MKSQALDLPLRRQQARKKTPKIASFIVLAILLSVISVYSPSLTFKKISQASSPLDSLKESSELERRHTVVAESYKELRQKRLNAKEEESEATRGPPTSVKNDETVNEIPEETWSSGHIINSKEKEKSSCDLFTGEWVPNPEAPYYTNTTCYVIQEHQNCMKYGRPDSEFLKWRWKPDGCELPIFDPHHFLELVRGKSIAFVGDSVARNHIQSLICVLSRVLYPREISSSTDENRQWEYKEFNFKISIFWAPYLVRSGEITGRNNRGRFFSLYLDEFDENWTTKIEGYDFVVISGGHWFFRPAMLYENGRIVSCLYCPQENVTHVTPFYSYQRAFRTAFRAINSLKGFKGVTFLRTFVPQHFENGTWDSGGNCPRTRPYKRNETLLADNDLEMYKIQLEELKIAQEAGSKRGLKFRLFDATKPMLLRPDGHPSRYGHWPTQTVEMPNDCVHWCLPGPIDTWSDFFLELLKRVESEKSVA